MVTALATLSVVAAVSGLLAREQRDALTLARHDAATARQAAQDADHRAGQAADVAHQLEAVARVNEQRADSLAALPVRVRYVTVRATAPDTCASLVAAADSALSNADSVASELRSANLSLHTALDSTGAALDAVRGSQRRLEAATADLERAARPSLLARALPRPGVGLAAGIDATGRPALVVGVTLGWSL